MKKHLLLGLIAFFVVCQLQAQTIKSWSAHQAGNEKIATDKAVARLSYPKEYKLFNLNIDPLRQELFSIVGATSKKQSTVISLPNADGQIEDFEVFEASNFEPELQAQFPEIRAYSGKGITDKYATLKLSISPQGIQTMVFRTDSANEFIEAYSQDHTVYAVYKSQREKGKLPWTCSTDDKKMVVDINSQLPNTNRSSAGQLKTMRLAQSVTAEYSAYYGWTTTTGNIGLVVTAVNNTMTRCNGVYEKDLGLHLNLIATTTNVFFNDPATDGYTDGDDTGYNADLQTNLTNIIGEGNYDIGHLFSAVGGITGNGNAGCIGCVCVDGTKGSGFTTRSIPLGDDFDIDFVVHEVGHQLGGNHTFTFSGEANQAGTLATANQVEVGSGITIMGYAGITSADVTPHSIDAYSAINIAQIQTNLAGKACPVTTVITANNATPIVALTGAAITIPISTPFALDCTGSDTNPGDALTYSWEQTDSPLATSAYIGNGVASSAAVAKTVGPNFISYAPTASTLRYFPKMTSVMANSATTGWVYPAASCLTCNANMLSEALSSVARILNFRVTVRDNAPYSSVAPIRVGQTNFTNLPVTTNTTGGAFSVSSQAAAGIVYAGASIQTITWVAGSTAAAPFNAINVDILITYNNGLTWTSVLVGTPNDGTQTVTMPNPAINQTNCRIMVRSAVTATQKSYFFDVNNVAFTINNNPLATDSFEFQDFGLFPNPNAGSFTIKFTSASTNEIKINAHDMRGRQVYEKSFSNNGAFNQNINLNKVEAGVYLVSIIDGAKKTVKRIVVE